MFLWIFNLMLAVPMTQLSPEFSQALSELNQLQAISGAAIGVAGTPGRFYVLSETCLKDGRTSDFIAMTQSPHPATRIMGAYCLIQFDKTQHADLLRSMFNDAAQVSWNPSGCTVLRDTNVGWIIKTLFDAPHTLGRTP